MKKNFRLKAWRVLSVKMFNLFYRFAALPGYRQKKLRSIAWRLENINKEMKMCKHFFCLMMLLMVFGVLNSSAAALDTISGTVSDSITNTPIDSVTVSSEGTSTTSNAAGNFKLVIPGTGVIRPAPKTISWDPRNNFSWSGTPGCVSMEVRNLSGSMIASYKNNSPSGRFSIARLPQGVYLATIRTPLSVDVFKIMKVRTDAHDAQSIVSRVSGRQLAKSAATGMAHIVVFSKAGYALDTMTVPVNTPSSAAIAVKLLKTVVYTVLFDGTNLDNWVVDPGHCSIKDSAIYIEGCWCMMWSKEDYDNFRLFVKTKIASPTYTSNAGNEHMGIGVWGARRTDFNPGNTVEFTPQNCWMWNYVKGNDSKSDDQCFQPNFGGSDGWDKWKSTEFLFNMTEGTVKSAVDGVKMSNFKMTDKSYFKKGPFGLQMHGSIAVEYKDIKVEVNPKDTNLVSVKP